MGAVTTAQGTRTSLTVTGFSTLAASAYVASSAYNINTNKPKDLIIEVEAATTNTASGNKQVLVFVQTSLDGTNFSTGPTSGTTATDEPDLNYIGSLPILTNSVTHRKSFSVKSALGFLPQQAIVVLRNDLGVALTSGAVYTAEIADSVA